jgi:hypothetical protein
MRICPPHMGHSSGKCLVDAGNQHRPQVMRRSLRACFRFGCGCGRVARRRHPRYARARLCSLHRGWLRRSRLSQRRYRRSQRRVWCQHTKVAVPVGAWRWHQRGDAVDQLQRCEVQLINLGTALVAGGVRCAACRSGTPVCFPLCAACPSQRVGGRNSARAAQGLDGRGIQCTPRHPPRSRCVCSPACLWRHSSPAGPEQRRRAGCVLQCGLHWGHGSRIDAGGRVKDDTRR